MTITIPAKRFSELDGPYSPVAGDLFAFSQLQADLSYISVHATFDLIKAYTLGDVSSYSAGLLELTTRDLWRAEFGITAALDLYAAIAPSADVQSFLGAADYAAMRTQLGLVIGTNVQPQDAELTAIAGLTSAADRVPYFTGSGTAALATFSSVGRTLVAQTTQALMRTTGLGMSANGSSLVASANYASMRGLLDLEAGTDFYSIAATDAAIAAAVAALINSAPGALDTLDELAAALGDDANFAATVTTALAGKQAIDADLTSWAGVTRAAGFDTFAATPSLANLASLLTNEASGFATFLQTPSLANLAAFLTDDATGAMTFLTTPSSANLRALLTDEVGTGVAYFVGGALGTPASGVLTNMTGLPVAQILAGTIAAVGFNNTSFSAGTKSSGTYTPDPQQGNIQHATNGGAHTLAPPTNPCSVVVEYTNNGSAGTITTSGFTKVVGTAPGTVNGATYHAFIMKTSIISSLTWVV